MDSQGCLGGDDSFPLWTRDARFRGTTLVTFRCESIGLIFPLDTMAQHTGSKQATKRSIDTAEATDHDTPTCFAGIPYMDATLGYFAAHPEELERFTEEMDLAYVRGLVPHVALVLCSEEVVAEYAARTPVPDPGADCNFGTDDTNELLMAVAYRSLVGRNGAPAHVPWPKEARLHSFDKVNQKQIQAWYGHMQYLQRRFGPLIRQHYAPVYNDDTRNNTDYNFVQAFGFRSQRLSAELRQRFAQINPACAAYMELFNARLKKADARQYARHEAEMLSFLQSEK